jgi:hypothetical protein
MKHPQDRPKTDGRIVIGWREHVALPQWGVTYLKAKVDTGARTSAIDVAAIEELEGERVAFSLVQDRRREVEPLRVVTDIVRRSRVKSSFGATHDRLIVSTLIRLGSVEKPIELSLVCRKNMLCRMLIGRKALEPEFLVDPSHRYLFGLRPRRRARV